MNYLPLFFDLKSSTALVFGSGHAAAKKSELLLKAGCQVIQISDEISPELESIVGHAGFKHLNKLSEDMWQNKQLVVAAFNDNDRNEEIAETARARNIPVNVLNRSDLSTYVFPSIIDRSPIIAAVSSGGELPVLSRLLRSRIESSIPHAYGRLATVAGKLRHKVKASIPNLTARRRFWETHLEGRFSELVFSGREQEAHALLASELEQNKANTTGEVYLVGAGPGDPDLLSFKALRLIRQADVVLYDRLVSEPILALVKQDAEQINVGKARSKHLVEQDSINDLLVQYAKQGNRVLRLKGGDPFIFGRGGEEIEKLAEHDVPFQVVPGITAASGCSAYSGIPLTHRDYSQSVRFITGHLKNNSCDLPWSEYVQDNQTLVFYMGLVGLPLISKSLIEHGMSPSMPVALVSKGTTREQRVVTGTLQDIAEKAVTEKVAAPTLIIIGEVVKLREKLKWHEDY